MPPVPSPSESACSAPSTATSPPHWRYWEATAGRVQPFDVAMDGGLAEAETGAEIQSGEGSGSSAHTDNAEGRYGRYALKHKS